MNSLHKAFTRPVSSERTDAKISSLLLYIFAVLVLVVGAVKIAPLARTEFEVVLITLAIVTLSILMVVFGQLLEINERLRLVRLETKIGESERQRP